MKQILVIEDDEIVRGNILELLTAEGFIATGSQDGEEGVRLTWESLPDLIICDVLMPRLDGFGVLARLRRDPLTATIPFLFLTALTSREDLRRGMGLGADDYITKPFTRNELLQAVNLRLRLHQERNALTRKKVLDLQRSLARNLPYELLTPLSVVIGFSEIIMDDRGNLSPLQIREMAQDIHASGERLHRLVENYILLTDLEMLLTDGAKLEAVRKSREETRANPLIHEIAHFIAHQRGRENDLVVDVEDQLLYISERHLEKILEELLDNAFVFSMAGTPVHVKAASHPQYPQYQISIQDCGRGMPRELSRQIGEVVYFDNRLFQEQGAGMGLLIVRRLVDVYQGSMLVTTPAEGGTLVQVNIPCA